MYRALQGFDSHNSRLGTASEGLRTFEGDELTVLGLGLHGLSGALRTKWRIPTHRHTNRVHHMSYVIAPLARFDPTQLEHTHTDMA